MRLSKNLQSDLLAYAPILVVSFITAFLVRVYESIIIYLKFRPTNLLISESLGFGKDIYQISVMLTFLFPLYSLLRRKSPNWTQYTFWFFAGLFLFLHSVILPYFFYQMLPLDIFLFKHKPDEAVFSIKTSETNIIYHFTITLILFAFWFSVRLFFRRHKIGFAFLKKLIVVLALNAIFFTMAQFWLKLPVTTNLYHNKTIFFFNNVIKDYIKNKLGPTAKKGALAFQTEYYGLEYVDRNYPFLHKFQSRDVLSPFFNLNAKKPNIVIIIVEGLAENFVHPIHNISFMPFLDSLSKASLYWDHFLSNGERSFAATPSINGSLPYGDIGFSLLDIYPYHFSLVNVLSENHYFTHFYYGQGAWFHGKERFYQFNNIDKITEKSNFQDSLYKVKIGEDQYFWGYHDEELMKQYFIENSPPFHTPRLDILFTGTSHSPFFIKDKERYENKFAEQLSLIHNEEIFNHFNVYKKYYLSLYNVDDALRYFIDTFTNREDCINTIFIITGDHPMTEIPAENPLKKYHVPLMIYSPMLKKGCAFKEVASFLDIYESLLSFLEHNYDLVVPKYSTALGDGLQCEKNLCLLKDIAMMNDNRQIIDFYSNGYFISNENTLFRVDSNFKLKEVYDNKKYYELIRRLDLLRSASKYASLENHLMPDSIFDTFFKYTLLKKIDHKDIIQSHSKEYSLLECKLPAFGKKLFCDVQFENAEPESNFPECHYVLSNTFNEIYRQGFVVKPEVKYNHQFQLQMDSLPENTLNYTFKLFFKNKQGLDFNLENLTIRLYYQ